MMKEYILFHMIALAAGCFLDLLLGDPRGIPHPIVAMGRLISFLDQRFHRAGVGDKKRELRQGVLTCWILMMTTLVFTALLLVGAYAIHSSLGILIEAVLTFYILAAKSLSCESKKVYRAVMAGDKKEARSCLSMIVGRDVDRLDTEAILRATVETVAENTSDGVTAPLIYTALGGPVLGMLYKAVNTMDSMIGYNNDRYRYYGRPAAKLDDGVNFLPSRISALLMILGAGILKIADPVFSGKGAFRIWKRDRLRHLSPNSAQTESACAGALGIRLGGRSYYGGVAVDKPYLGDDLRTIEGEDVLRAGRLMYVTEGITFLIAEGIMLLLYL